MTPLPVGPLSDNEIGHRERMEIVQLKHSALLVPKTSDYAIQRRSLIRTTARPVCEPNLGRHSQSMDPFFPTSPTERRSTITP